MPPRIKNIAVIATPRNKDLAIGEAPKKGEDFTSSMTPQQKTDMLGRLFNTIEYLAAKASFIHQKELDETPQDDRQDTVTRLATNEFFFYTKEPLTLKEFELLQNKIHTLAQKQPEGVFLLLGTFAVQAENGSVMNVAPHIACGATPQFHFILKNFDSPLDYCYKKPHDSKDDYYTFPLINKKSPLQLPFLQIAGKLYPLMFNNIIECKTPSGISFLSLIDICLDHGKGVAFFNIVEKLKQDHALANNYISHIVISNGINLITHYNLQATLVDPLYLKKCKDASLDFFCKCIRPYFGDPCEIYEVATYSCPQLLSALKSTIRATLLELQDPQTPPNYCDYFKEPLNTAETPEQILKIFTEYNETLQLHLLSKSLLKEIDRHDIKIVPGAGDKKSFLTDMTAKLNRIQREDLPKIHKTLTEYLESLDKIKELQSLATKPTASQSENQSSTASIKDRLENIKHEGEDSIPRPITRQRP